MIRIPISDDDVLAAQQRRAELDTTRGTGMQTQGFATRHRWVGDLGELGLRRLLDDREIAYTAHGGLDSKPDLEIGSIGVAVKTKWSQKRFHESHKMGIAQQHAHAAGDVILFAVVEQPSMRLIFPGVITRKRFLEIAVEPKTLADGSEPHNPLLEVPARALTPLADWLKTIDSRQHSGARAEIYTAGAWAELRTGWECRWTVEQPVTLYRHAGDYESAVTEPWRVYNNDKQIASSQLELVSEKGAVE